VSSSAGVKRVQTRRAAAGPAHPIRHIERACSLAPNICVLTSLRRAGKRNVALPTDIQLSVWNRNWEDLRLLCGLPVVLQVVLCGLPVVLQVVPCGLSVLLQVVLCSLPGVLQVVVLCGLSYCRWCCVACLLYCRWCCVACLLYCR
jgi:hypothetical protein